jgi:hypothetical protein
VQEIYHYLQTSIFLSTNLPKREEFAQNSAESFRLLQFSSFSYWTLHRIGKYLASLVRHISWSLRGGASATATILNEDAVDPL